VPPDRGQERKRARTRRAAKRPPARSAAASPVEPASEPPRRARQPAAAAHGGIERRGPEANQDDPSAETLRLSELMRPEVVTLELHALDQWGAVEELIAKLVEARELSEKLAPAALAATREREAIMPTGWKYGLAFPNGRVRGLRRILAAVGLSRFGVEFGCRDRLPARIIVLFLFPEARYARFAPAIGEVAHMLEDTLLREAILAAREPDEVVEAIEDAEARDVT
jgi:PTS system nitrogen regulatory IIA component